MLQEPSHHMMLTRVLFATITGFKPLIHTRLKEAVLDAKIHFYFLPE